MRFVNGESVQREMAVDERLTLPTAISNQQFDRHHEALGIRTTMKHIREHREPRTITPTENRERGRRCHLYQR